MNRLISIILTVATSISQIPTALADGASEANRQLALSHEKAKTLASQLYTLHLYNSFVNSVATNSDLSRVNASLKALSGRQSQRLKELRTIESKIANAEFLYWDVEYEQESLRAFQHDLSRAQADLQDLKKNVRNMLYEINRSGMSALSNLFSTEQFVRDFSKYCAEGVGVSVFTPNVEALPFLSPNFAIGFNLGMSFGPDGTQVTNVTPYSTPNLLEALGIHPEDEDYAAMAGTVSYALLTGGLMIWAGLGAVAASLAAGGAMAAISLSVLAIEDINQRNKATRQADAIEDYVQNRATSADVAAYFRETCNQFGEPIFEIAAALSTNQPLRDITPEEKDFADSVGKKLNALQRSLETKRAQLVESGLKDKGLSAALSRSAERGNLDRFLIEEIGNAGLTRLIAIMTLNIHKAAKEARANSGKALGSRFVDGPNKVAGLNAMIKEIESAQQKLNNLFALSRRLTLIGLYPDVLEILQSEEDSQQNFTRFYLSFQIVVADHMRSVLQGISPTVDWTRLEELKEEAKIILSESHQLRAPLERILQALALLTEGQN